MRPFSWFHRRGAFTPVAFAAACILAVEGVGRISAGAGADAAAVLGIAFMVVAWREGERVWPSHETVPTPPVGTTVRDVETALGGGSTPLRIAVIGDIQNGVAELVDLLREARRRGHDLVLLLGDCANAGRPERYALLRTVLRENLPGVPVLAVPGNHDLDDAGSCTTWTSWVGPPHWRLDLRGWRLLGLDDAAGPLTPASVALLRESAASPPPRGLVLVSHRQLFARDDETRDVVRARVRQLAASGLSPAPVLALAGHGHANEEFTDAAGTRHVVQGENCDRSGESESAFVGAATMTLGDGPPAYEIWRVRRRARLADELRRLAVTGVFPWIRGRWLGPLLWAAGLLASVAVRRLIFR